MSRFFARALIAAALVLAGWLIGGWFPALLGAAVSAPMFVRTQDGRIWWAAIGTRLRFRIASARGLTRYTDDDALPGPLGDTTMTRDQPYGIITDERGFFSVVVPFDPLRSDWLEAVAEQPDLVAVSITTQTGSALASGFSIANSAGALTRAVLHEALSPTATLPAAWSALTWRAGQGDADSCAEVVDAFVDRTDLDQPLPGPTIAALVSTAFRPDGEPVTVWDQAGPGSAHEFKNRYQHAGLTSVVWQASAGSADLSRLLSEETAASLERVTAVYTAQPDGGGLRQRIVVTVTCPEEQALAVAASAIRVRAGMAGVTLAPCAATMASSFAAGLGVGAVGGPR